MGYLFWIGTAVLAIGAVSLLRSFFTKKKKSSKSVSAFPEGEYQMVVIINTDFKMSKGKVLSQFGHAIDAAHRQLRKNLDLEHAWRKSGSAKIALKGNTAQLEEIYLQAKELSIPRQRIVDAGRTQVPPGSNTCIVLGPSTKPELSPITKGLSLY